LTLQQYHKNIILATEPKAPEFAMSQEVQQQQPPCGSPKAWQRFYMGYRERFVDDCWCVFESKKNYLSGTVFRQLYCTHNSTGRIVAGAALCNTNHV
jgi:hypothetical protein